MSQHPTPPAPAPGRPRPCPRTTGGNLRLVRWRDGRRGLALLPLLTMLVTGCATVQPDHTLATTRQQLGAQQDALTLQRDDDQRAQASRSADTLLAQPLDADAAQRLALLQSPALQALLAEAWAADIAGAAAARPADLRLTWERMVHGGETELTRSLGLGLTDLLLWPARARAADRQGDARRLALAQQVLAHGQAVRQQWLRAVAARELLGYHEQVREAADASAELARRMQSVGNFNRLRRAREQAFQADAVARLAQAVQAEVAEREALVRLLGLDSEQALRLQLPERLPALPAQPRDAAEVTRIASTQRIDLALARRELDARLAEGSAGGGLASVVDIEASLIRSRSGDERARGTELELSLPVLDAGAAKRAKLDARQLIAFNRLAQAQREAASLLRERYAGYRSAFDLAQQARGTLLPLRQTIADEMLLNYNGMLVGVFELLAEARAQVGAVITTIEAQRDFWLADAALQAAIQGVPAAAPTPAGGAAAAAAEPAGH